MASDDERLARASRLLRRELGLTQRDAAGDGRSRRFVQRLEDDLAGSLRLDDLRGHFDRLGARVRVTVWWNGANLDRLLDALHADLLEQAIAVLRSHSWLTDTEVTFSKWGERGSIDVFGWHVARRALFIGEVKSEWGSIEETNRSLDVKARLAPEICEERLGWRPRALARVLILPDAMTARRVAARHAETLDSAYPARSREVRHWVRQPEGPLRGLWFLSQAPPAKPRIGR